MWRRGYEVLATGHLVVSADPRISVEKHSGVNTLVLKHISEQDAGEYVCQVNTYYCQNQAVIFCTLFQISILNDILSVKHTLDVLGKLYHTISYISYYGLPKESYCI